jgi:uncharacterized protein (TIGR02147 family)
MNIYSFTDYRKFLQETFSDLQRKNRTLSMREILRRIGCTSPSYYKEVVVDVKKNMSMAMARKIAAFLKLDPNAMEYFVALVGYNQAKTELERNHHYQQLILHNRGAIVENHFLTPNELAYFSTWEIPAIRELLLFYKNFKNRTAEERRKLAERFYPELSEVQVREAIELLEKLDFIKKDLHGNYRRTGQNIRQVKKNPLTYYMLRQNMKHAVQIINRISPDIRIFKNVTISMSEQAYKILEKKIQEFCGEVSDIVSNDSLPADRLYTLGIQLFPLTRTIEKGNE